MRNEARLRQGKFYLTTVTLF